MLNAWKNYSLYDDLMGIYREEEREAKDYISTICKKEYTVILFGSRARGDNKIYSDWDILVIGKERPPIPPASIDLHYVSLDRVDEKIKDFNAIVIDAFYEGKVQCDNLSIYDNVKRKVLERIRGYRKTKEGWFREDNTNFSLTTHITP
ncbi:nucleotidyltransferase domain-containing protein [Saccharolobus shibatae]|uniref:nucleotidyltransferase domain-containing protein n=1 Tax=Saccharolobus shibatae TaxID=2286 RepID=UPI001C44055B|nr:nucleotidyltransferase domain-containing protein [Saccharolobus shibatae]